MSHIITPLLAGLLFGAGLLLSGMADPANVIGFLQLGAAWNPSLAFVFAGALMITVPGFFWLRRRSKPFAAASFASPPVRPVTRRLLIGSALFGVGWGIAGFCPGPAVAAAGLLQGAALLFLPAFVIGGKLADKIIGGGHD